MKKIPAKKKPAKKKNNLSAYGAAKKIQARKKKMKGMLDKIK